MRRILLPLIGVLVFLAGIAFCVLPGPGLPLVCIGGTLLAERSRQMARAMDWCELKLRRIIRWAKEWWCAASLTARHAVIVLAAFIAAGAGYGAYQFLFNR